MDAKTRHVNGKQKHEREQGWGEDEADQGKYQTDGEFNRRQDEEDMVRKDELTVKMPIGKWSGKDRLNVLDALRWNVKIKLMKIVSNNMPPVA